MAARWLAFCVWAVVGAAAVFWLSRLAGGGPPVPAHATVAPVYAGARGQIARVLGEDEAPPPAAAPVAAPAAGRFRLVGVVAPRGQDRAPAVALIVVDDKPARAFRLGAAVDGNTVVQSVAARGVVLGPRNGPAEVELALPPLPAAATGSLPAVSLVTPPAVAPQPYTPATPDPSLAPAAPDASLPRPDAVR